MVPVHVNPYILKLQIFLHESAFRPNEENDVTIFAFLQMVWRSIPTQDWISN